MSQVVTYDRDVFTDSYQPLIKAFEQYKAHHHLPAAFGRDAILERPQKAKDEELFHLHLNLSGFPKGQRQYQRTSDVWLLYTRGFWNLNSYHLIAILEPDAHDQARNITLIGRFADIAEKFRANN